MARELKDGMQAESSDIESLNQTPGEIFQDSIQIQLSPESEKELVEIILADFEAAKSAKNKREFARTSKGESVNFDKWFKDINNLYNANREPKTLPWKFCSNRSLRIAAAILDTLHSRLFPAVVNEELLRWRPGEVNDVPKVDRVSKLMHWWFWVRSRMRQTLDNWVKVVTGYGESIVESSWKSVPIDKGKTIEQPVTGPDGQPLINPDGTPAVMKSRVIDLMESTCSNIYLPNKFFLQEGSTDITREPVILEETKPYRELEDGEAQQKYVNVEAMLRGMLPVGDESHASLPPEEREKMRSIKIRNHPVTLIKWYGNYDADGDGFAEDIRIYVVPEYRLYLGGIPLTKITKSGARPLNFTKFESRLECPEQNWGVGVLEKVKELSEEIDAIFNQMTDGNTLSILMPFFYDPGGDTDAPNLTIAPNRGVPISNPNQNVFFPQINIQVDRLLNAIRLVLEFIERLTAASAYVLGKESEVVGGSGTATRTNAIMQSAEQRFALPAERLREGAASIVNHHLSLLQLNIPPGLERRILGEKGEPLFEANELSQEGISGEFDAYLLPDPAMGSKQSERDLAGMFYSLLMQNPLVATDPSKVYQVTKDMLKSYGKENDVTRLIGPEPEQDLIDDPEDENTLMVQGDFKSVRAHIAENHIYHIMKHGELMQSPSLVELSANAPMLVQQVMQFNQQHIQEHMAMLQQMMAIMQKGASGGKGSGKPGASGTERAGIEQGMGQTSGPLGEALNTKREGEGGSYSPSQIQ